MLYLTSPKPPDVTEYPKNTDNLSDDESLDPETKEIIREEVERIRRENSETQRASLLAYLESQNDVPEAEYLNSLAGSQLPLVGDDPEQPDQLSYPVASDEHGMEGVVRDDSDHLDQVRYPTPHR